MDLHINTQKTKVIGIFRNPNHIANVTIDRTPISKVSKLRYLGSWISEDLNPDI